jgi:hypothetical protein
MLLTVPEYAGSPSDTIASDNVLAKEEGEVLATVAAAVEAAAGVRPVATRVSSLLLAFSIRRADIDALTET